MMEMRSDGTSGWERYRLVDGPNALERILFQHEYTDELGNDVTFQPKGVLTGLSGKDRHEVLFDFTEGHESEDIVFIHAEGDTAVWDHHAYHFRFQSDTLLLYSMEFLEPHVFKVGPLWKRLLPNTADR